MVKLTAEETQFMKQMDKLFDSKYGVYGVTRKDTVRYNSLLAKMKRKTMPKKKRTTKIKEPSINPRAFKAFFGRSPGKLTYKKTPARRMN